MQIIHKTLTKFLPPILKEKFEQRSQDVSFNLAR